MIQSFLKKKRKSEREGGCKKKNVKLKTYKV